MQTPPARPVCRMTPVPAVSQQPHDKQNALPPEASGAGVRQLGAV